MVATYAIVYATKSAMHRRTIVDDDGQITIGLMPDGVTKAVICEHENRLPSYHPLHPGESALVETVSGKGVDASDHYDWMDSIENATGIPPPTIRCAMVNEAGKIEHIVIADPDIDEAPPGLTLVECYSPAITTDCTYDHATGLFTMPACVIPPHAPGNTTDSPIEIPPAVIPNEKR